MNRLLPVLAGTLCAMLVATPAVAQLQWQTTGVRQASHVAPAPAPAKQASRRTDGRRQLAAKAPTTSRQQSAAKTKPAPVVQAAAIAPSTRRAGSARPEGVRFDPAVEPVCLNGACGCNQPCDCPAPCDCGPVCGGCCEPTCGYGGCGAACEPACGLTYGEPCCGCGDIGCVGGCGDACGCGDVCYCDDGGVPILLRLPPLKELTFFGGVQGFKNPLDAGRDRSNFGFNVGVNAGGKMTLLGLQGLGYQIGYRSAFSQLHGTSVPGSTDGHTQQFFTAGLFHRKAVGLQYGVVYDLLRDERQLTVDFGQVRGLISVTNPHGHEIGFQFASSVNENLIVNNVVNGTYQATDQYLFFYRLHGCEGGDFRFFGGFDDDEKGIVGVDANVPLTDRFALQTGFTYLIPEDDGPPNGANDEAWNIGMNLVWHYGCRARRSAMAPYRPMFNVADNGSMIIDAR